jgi:hypothetical protein
MSISAKCAGKFCERHNFSMKFSSLTLEISYFSCNARYFFHRKIRKSILILQLDVKATTIVLTIILDNYDKKSRDPVKVQGLERAMAWEQR